MGYPKYTIGIIVMLTMFAIVSCTKTEPGTDQANEFYKLFGGVYHNEAVDIIMFDNHYYIVGNVSAKNGKQNVMLIKTDTYGNALWQKTFNSDTNTICQQVILSNNQQNLIIIGSQTNDSDSLYNDIKLWITTLNGDSVLYKTLYKPGNEVGKSVAQTTTGGYIIAADSAINATSTTTKRLVLVTDALGTPTNYFAGTWPNSETVSKFTDLGNNHFALVGMSKNHSNPTYSAGAPFLSVFDANATELVNFHFNISGEFTDVASYNNTLYVCGTSYTGPNGNRDIFLASVSDQSDQFLWIKQVGTANNDHASRITVSDLSQLTVCGNTLDNNDKSNAIVINTDMLGNVISQATIGGQENEYGIKAYRTEDKYLTLETSMFSEYGMITLVMKPIE